MTVATIPAVRIQGGAKKPPYSGLVGLLTSDEVVDIFMPVGSVGSAVPDG